jgi:hypothetical protein
MGALDEKEGAGVIMQQRFQQRELFWYEKKF